MNTTLERKPTILRNALTTAVVLEYALGSVLVSVFSQPDGILFFLTTATPLTALALGMTRLAELRDARASKSRK